MLGEEQVQRKVLQYEAFISDVLQRDLQKVLEQREEVYEKIAQYLQLKNVIERLQETGAQELKTQVDLGCNFYVNAEVLQLLMFACSAVKGTASVRKKGDRFEICAAEKVRRKPSIHISVTNAGASILDLFGAKAPSELFSDSRRPRSVSTHVGLQKKEQRDAINQSSAEAVEEAGKRLAPVAVLNITLRPETSTIFVALGYGFFVELTLPEALAFIEKKNKLLTELSEALTKDSAKIKANIRMVLEGLRELQGLKDLPEETRRDIFL